MSPRSLLQAFAYAPRRRRSFRLLALALPFLLAMEAASAAPKDRRDGAAKRACLSGDYAKGVALLADLYVSSGDINYLFNQARCFEQNGKFEEAIVRFLEYQRKNRDKGNPPDAEAERHIAECQALLDKRKPAAPTPTATTTAPAPEPVTAPTGSVAAPPAPVPSTLAPIAAQAAPVPSLPLVPLATPAPVPQVQIAQASPAAVNPGLGLRVAGIATAAVGLAGIATGAILNAKANSLASELQATKSSYSRSTESTRSSYETFGWVGYGAGATCLVGGAILYYLGFRQAHASQVAFVPDVGPDSITATVKGAF